MPLNSTNKKIKIEYEEENASSSNPRGGPVIPPMMPNVFEDNKDDVKPPVGNSSSADAESERVKSIREYKQRIRSSYQPMHRELFEMNFTGFLVPSLLEAINESTENGVRRIISEPTPGLIIFDMFKPEFCQMLLEEFGNFKKWAWETKTIIMRPNTMYRYGVVLADLGMETMIGKLMKDFILPMSTIFFPEVGGDTIDSYHGFIVEYGADTAHHLDFHVDDSEVTLNVCLGEKFYGGELFLRGVRCVKHLNVDSELKEIFDYSQVPGRAVLHRGRHRHGALSTTSGHRVNMLLWCKSSIFREMSKEEQNSPSWCGVCRREEN
ncbi:2-oxoglutarate and Fe(II)-dependent oxygenase superfamily protein [Heracleum sosnowskyi]|uniref:2-oxoglutarate and Fe(II)-dependent oxygenase superfamily protein n=1 Tax=Heracleum sosnowskyi TaxID=360622 RepID=A0AAD8IMH8_9APIA|nr:2-oxoglutarate and Fe(II)-dependent oxygenase superfamily protein [Heracleum sosnowskyi]